MQIEGGYPQDFSTGCYGSNDVIVDGQTFRGKRRRAKGLYANLVMTVDPIVEGVSLTEPIGASSSFFDTSVGLVPVGA